MAANSETEESSVFSDLIPRIGFIRDLIGLGQTGTNVGFTAASACTQFGFRVATNAIGFSADAVDTVMGGNEISGVLRSVHTTVGAAEAVALTSILMAHSAAAISLHAADATLELTGVQRTEGFVWQSLRAALPTQFAEYTPVIQQIAEMVLSFVAPIKELSHAELRETLVAYALLQQANRLPMRVLPPRRSSLPPDFVRCMGFAAAAYGHLAMNFLEFIPRGIYQSDVLPLLVPGVSSADILCKNEDVSLYSTGFVLVKDRLKQTLVLAVRGSFHVNDIITDLTCQHANCSHLFTGLLNESGDGDGRGVQEVLVHEGFLLAANSLDALLQEEVRVALSLCDAPYSLVITGHSLGAGVASVLTMKWRTIFPSVRCVALAPPCVFSINGARASSPFITSVVIGDDMVSRLSLSSSYDLRNAAVRLHNEIVVQESDAATEDNSIVPNAGHQDHQNQARSSPRSRGANECVGEENRGDSVVRSRPFNWTQLVLDTNMKIKGVATVQYQYTTLERSGDTELFEYSQFSSIEPIAASKPSTKSKGGDSGFHRGSTSQSIDETCSTNSTAANTVQSAHSSAASNGSDGSDERELMSLRDLKHIMDALRTEEMTHTKLYPPGRVVHIVDTAQWDRDVSEGIVMSSDMYNSDCGFTLNQQEGFRGGCVGEMERSGGLEWEGGTGSGGGAFEVLRNGLSVEVICRTEESIAYEADQLTFAELQLSADMFSSHMPTQCLYKLRELFPLTT